VATLAGAERAALELTCERAALADGQRILELGCGWGSLTLFMAQRYPYASIVAVSN
jgi:cyclopropane-fatty-acyl-phospholipid synthase